MYDPSTIVGVDPGKTTGMSLFYEGGFVSGGEAKGIPKVAEILDVWNPDLIVMENFLGGYGHVNHYDPTTVIGGVQMWSHINEVGVILQSPAILRSRLKLADGLHESKHVRCSAAHVFHYLRKSAS